MIDQRSVSGDQTSLSATARVTNVVRAPSRAKASLHYECRNAINQGWTDTTANSQPIDIGIGRFTFTIDYDCRKEWRKERSWTSSRASVQRNCAKVLQKVPIEGEKMHRS
jgi:hypothetical protein